MESVRNRFPASLLNAKYVKRTNKGNKMIETVIKNDFQGLCDYFTAPNIRRKIRHPIFLAIKFSECIKFFYNKAAFPSSSVILFKHYKA
jgi:hypothetical protein